ncbi:MAG: Na(+)-translocating NADH:ubiquinone reductase subunit C [Rikenellaceae bacterium]
MANYICKVCGYVHTGDSAPETCPVCKVPASEFEIQKQESKGLFADKNGNAYILTYATAMVVMVAAVLAFVAMQLQPLQETNVLNEKKMAILTALSAEAENYDEYITAFAVDKSGAKVESVSEAAVIDLLSDLSAAHQNGILPIFQAADGRVVIPVTGSGLWGAIWGYVALQEDMSTIAGIVIDHASETPGLGAEIATAKHQAMYVGKELFEGSDFVSVKLIKGGAATSGSAAKHEVDAITGGTKTSDGVSAMLRESLGSYMTYFEQVRGELSNNKK